MLRPWFENRNCSAVTITKYTSISKHTVEKSLSFENTDFIEGLVGRIERILPDGDMMISFGPDAEHIELCFEIEGLIQKIHFYSKKIKTPSTGFNSFRSQDELSIYRDIDAILFPEVSKNILKLKDLEISFPDFSITYLGSTYRDEAPVSLSFTTDKYLILDEKGAEQIVEITSGQLPPQPVTFKVGNASFVLNSFQNNSGDLLNPNYF